MIKRPIINVLMEHTLLENPSQELATIGGLVGTLLCILLLLLLAVAFFSFWRKRRANTQEKTETNTKGGKDESRKTANSVSILQPSTATPEPPATAFRNSLIFLEFLNISLPPHLVLEKGSDLRKKAKKMSENTSELEKEFKKMVAHVREKVPNERKVGSQDWNKPHNRYLDIGIVHAKSVAFNDICEQSSFT